MLKPHIFGFQKSDSVFARNRPAQFDRLCNRLVHRVNRPFAAGCVGGIVHKMYVVVSVARMPENGRSQTRLRAEIFIECKIFRESRVRQHDILTDFGVSSSYIDCEAERRTRQSFSISEFSSEKLALEISDKTDTKFAACFSVSFLSPSNSAKIAAEPSGMDKSGLRLRTQETVSASINSKMQGDKSAFIIFPIPANAASSFLKKARAAVFDFGKGKSFSHASTTTARVPSEPMKISRRFNPTEYFFRGNAPEIFSPSAKTAVSAKTFSRVVPYFRARKPPALQAILPPIDEYLCDDGSGA